MADAYGALVIGFSEGFEGDKTAIATSLNELGFDNFSGNFVVKDEHIWNAGNEAQYPSLAPTRDKIVVVLRDGVETRMDASELSDSDRMRIIDVEEEEFIPLSEIASLLSKSISKGTLYVSCCSNEKQRSVDSGYLSVNADGSGRRVIISHWVGKEATVTDESC